MAELTPWANSMIAAIRSGAMNGAKLVQDGFADEMKRTIQHEVLWSSWGRKKKREGWIESILGAIDATSAALPPQNNGDVITVQAGISP